MKIISERRRESVVSFSLEYRYEKGGGGFGFPCNEQGEPLPLNEAAAANLAACRTGMVRGMRVKLHGITREGHIRTIPAVGLCECGAHVQLDSSWANECEKCGTEYNGAGQRLAPRAQWGEETGERFY